nr:OB-fold domain-containing protein [Mycobacterium sp.]
MSAGAASSSPASPNQVLIEHCDECARWVHPAAGECRDCGAPLVAQPVSGRGAVFTYTVNHHAFNPEIPTPYVIAIVELVEQSGLRIAANIVDCEPDSVRCGMPVQARSERGAGGAPLFAPA